MAHKKAGASSRNGRDSKAKRLGVKRYDGEYVTTGNVIMRQRGYPYLPRPQRRLGPGLHPLCTLGRAGQVRVGRQG